ncbi:MAG: type II secretion system protein GspJ [Fimbriimonadaceae bacterium]
MKKRGFTLIEMVIALTMSMLIIGSIVTAFEISTQYQRTTPDRLNAFQESLQSRKTLDTLFRGAYISADTLDLQSYFVAADSTGQSTSADGLVFTTLCKPVSGGYLLSESTDSEELHDQFGPQGGISEVSLNITPVGSPTNDQSGLFLRIQTPSDGDPTQGGTEQLLIAGVTSVTYELWDGLQWATTWDTINGGTRRIPSAIRLTLNFEEGDPQYMVFQIPGSDVTAENPLTQTSGATGP